MMSMELAKACRAVAEQQWVTFDEEPDGAKRPSKSALALHLHRPALSDIVSRNM